MGYSTGKVLLWPRVCEITPARVHVFYTFSYSHPSCRIHTPRARIHTPRASSILSMACFHPCYPCYPCYPCRLCRHLPPLPPPAASAATCRPCRHLPPLPPLFLPVFGGRTVPSIPHDRCEPGKYTKSNRSVGCLQCAEGKAIAEPGQLECETCFPKPFMRAKGLTDCWDTWSPEAQVVRRHQT